MNFSVTVQGTFYKIVVAASFAEALAQVVKDRSLGLIAGYNSGAPANIQMRRV